MENQSAGAAPEAVSESTNESLETSQEQNTAGSEPATEAAAPLTKTEIKKIKALKLKVDGKEFNEDLPFEIDENPEVVEYLTKKLQLANVSQKRMGEKAQLEKELTAFFQDLKTNPRKVLSDPNLSIDLKKLAAEVIEEEIANSQKSPEQLEKEKLQRELKSIKEEREKEKEDFNRKEAERLTEQAYEQYDVQMTKALENSDLPKSPYVIKKLADYALIAVQRGVNISMEDLIPIVRDEISGDLKQMFAAMPEDVIEQIIGKDVFTKIRKKNLAKAKAGTPPIPVKAAVKDVGASNKPAAKPGEKKSFRDFFGV